MINILELECSKGWGGQEKRTARLINGLDKQQFKVYYGVFKESKSYKRAEEIDAEILDIPIRQSYDLPAVLKILKIVKEKKIDIISTHSGKDGLIGAIAGKIAGVNVIRTRHLQTPINSALSYNLSTKVVSVSQNVRDYLISAGVKEQKCEVIYTGIDTEKFNPKPKTDLKKELGIAEERVLIGIVAVLRKAKRHVMLIDAIKELPNVHLAIIGDGPQEKNIREKLDSIDYKERVHLLGHREDVSEILPSLDMFVLPSNMEALGTSILEASACGVPCIGSKVGGIPECIFHGDSGFLFENENLEELKEKITILANDAELRKFMGAKARERILERFSNEVMIAKTEELYRELVQ